MKVGGLECMWEKQVLMWVKRRKVDLFDMNALEVLEVNFMDQSIIKWFGHMRG